MQKRAAAANGASEAKVIREALESLDRQDQERQTIQQQRNDAWRAGTQDFDDFDAEFRSENGI